MRTFLVACLLMLEQKYNIITDASFVFVVLALIGGAIAITQDINELIEHMHLRGNKQ